MKYFLVPMFLSLFTSYSYEQTNNEKINSSTILKRGFYKSYEEFINNTPSMIDEFIVVPLSKSKKDSMVIGAEYELKDTLKKLNHVWGFCDGTSVYVNYSHPLSPKKYWKLECLGPYPFFTFSEKNIYAFGPPLLKIATAAVSAAAPPSYNLMVIDTKGKFRNPDVGLTKKFLAPHPDLLKSFKEQADRYQKYDNANSDEFESDEVYEAKMRIIKEYLFKLNQVLLNNQP